MQTDSRYQCGATVAVVSGIGHVLELRPKVDTAPHVKTVIALQDRFASIVQTAIT